MAKIKLPAWSIPLLLLLACVLSFGLLIPWLGFYWDDWPSIWYLHFLGADGFIEVLASDRPLLGRLYLLTTTLFGESTISWQVFGFMARWTSSLALWWLLRLLWPRHHQQAAWISILFALYPGFSQQFIALTYSHVFVVLTLFILSMATMILGVRRTHWSWLMYGLSLLLSAFSMFTVEYFFGLELLRPVILWLELKAQIENKRQRLLKVMVYWLPYLGIMIGFLIWRILLFETPRGEVLLFNNLQDNPLDALLALIRTVLSDVIAGSLLAWLQTFNFFNLVDFGLLPTILYTAIVLTAAALFAFLLYNFRHPGSDDSGQQPDDSRNRAITLVLIGILGLLVAGWPFWSTDLPIRLDFPWDRFTLPMMMGTSLILGGMILLLTRNRLLRILLIGLLAGLAIGLHFQNANHFRREWNAQKALFWQLTWRAPGIEPGTMLLTSEMPFEHYSDNSLTAPLNWTYAPEMKMPEMPYLLYQIESRLGLNLPDFKPGIEIFEDYRAAFFNGSTDQVLVYYYAPPGCVQMLDPELHARLPQKPKHISSAMPLSNLDWIIPDPEVPAVPPAHILGPAPDPDWCYYFEKADLARQLGQWEQVVEFAEQAFQLDTRLYPVNAPELLPYIEGYALTGDWQRAMELTHESYTLTFRMERALCDIWGRIAATVPQSDGKSAAVREMSDQFQCDSP
jgi:hypothetical protein